jgi:hypothetical protein
MEKDRKHLLDVGVEVDVDLLRLMKIALLRAQNRTWMF